MKSQELKKKYIEFFKSKNHREIPNASLIPVNDPSVLFVIAGMQPIVPYLTGQKHPLGKRLVNVQKCIRTVDIEEVGDTYHHTFFEMLGNWSLGDYFKKEAIEYSFEFLTKVLEIPIEKLAITCFEGNKNAPKDEEAAEVWLNLGFPQERIAFLGKDNWWEPGGDKSPCGPSTEMFYWKSDEEAPKEFDPEDETWVEIGNDVLMGYMKEHGKYSEAKQKNIDFGGGVERTLAVLHHYDDNYLTELWQPIIKQLEKLSDKKYKEDKKSFRIVADHIRSAVFMMGDPRGIAPSNKDQGYVLRRLIRRAIRFAKKINIDDGYIASLGALFISGYCMDYPELERNENFIRTELQKEEEKFSKTLTKGLKEFAKQKNIDGKAAFILFSTYGFPLEMTEELAQENNIKINKEEFEAEFKKHQELSRTASAGMFKGGLADDGEMATKYHTTTHLLHQALKDVLGDHVEQRGSNINEQRLRFDFTHPQAMTPEEKKKVEDIVNEQIKFGLEVRYEEMSVAQAKEQGAIGLFDKKYGEKIKVYKIGLFSNEICGGPHVDNTNKLGHFRIKKEQSSSAGIRRIKAVLE